MKALVIGGSLGGLFAANLLRREGWEVELFERVPDALAGRGAGIVTHPELLDILRRCGVRIDDSIGVMVPVRITLDSSGRIAGELPMPQIMTAWGRLYALLKAEFPAQSYHPGHALERIELHADRVVAGFTNGRRVDGDLLVGADGIRSSVRAQYLPSATPQYVGYVAWRGLVDEQAVSASTHAALFGCFGFCLPEGEQMLGYPVAGAGDSTRPGQRRYNFVWYRPAAEAELVDLLTDASGRTHEGSIAPPLIRGEVLERVRQAADALLAPQFAEIVRLAPQLFFQPIYDLESAQMVFGRAVLLGDAAFVARPHVGMGVTKAAEDALALAQALGSGDQLSTALTSYERSRLDVGKRVVARARHLGAYMQAQIRTIDERAMAQRYRTPEMVMRETAAPAHEWIAGVI